LKNQISANKIEQVNEFGAQQKIKKKKDKHQKICDGGIYQHWRLHSHLFGTKYALACNFITKNKKKMKATFLSFIETNCAVF
jgi:hypothetical protein